MSFEDQLMAMMQTRIDGVTRKINEVAYGVLVESIMRIDMRSPVGDISLWKYPERAPKGYRGGQFRGNWQLGINSSPIGALYGNIDPSGSSTVAKNIAAIGHGDASRTAYGKTYYLVNNLPYAAVLEAGHHSSQVGPGGMIGLYRIEFKDIIDKVVNEIKARGERVR